MVAAARPRGNPNWKKGVSGNPGGGKPGHRKLAERVKQHFADVLDRPDFDLTEYLFNLSQTDPKTFMAATMRFVPVAIDQTVDVRVSIGDAMADAEKRLIIDVTPAPAVSQPSPAVSKSKPDAAIPHNPDDTLQVQPGQQSERKAATPRRRKGKGGQG